MALAAPFPAARPSRTRTSPAARSSRTASSPGGVRLTRRGRVAVILAATGVLFAAVVASGAVTAEAGASTGGAATAVVVVQPGETLWQIARSVAPGTDPRETVLEIRELNGLEAQTVVPGQSLVVPAA